jgi:hypothetical protein
MMNYPRSPFYSYILTMFWPVLTATITILPDKRANIRLYRNKAVAQQNKIYDRTLRTVERAERLAWKKIVERIRAQPGL